LLTYEIHIDEKDKPHIVSYFDEIQPLYHRVSASSVCLSVHLFFLLFSQHDSHSLLLSPS